MNIPPSLRPVHTLQGGRWKTIRKLIALKRPFTVEVEGLFYAPCTDLSDLVGAPAFIWTDTDGTLYVFDFSASHLCRNQLERIRQAYANVS